MKILDLDVNQCATLNLVPAKARRIMEVLTPGVWCKPVCDTIMDSWKTSKGVYFRIMLHPNMDSVVIHSGKPDVEHYLSNKVKVVTGHEEISSINIKPSSEVLNSYCDLMFACNVNN